MSRAASPIISPESNGISKFPGYQAATEASAEFKDEKEITATRVAKTPTASTGMEKLGSQQDYTKTTLRFLQLVERVFDRIIPLFNGCLREPLGH